MSISFDDDRNQYSNNSTNHKETGLTGLIISTGLVRTKTQAQIIMLVLIVIMVAILFFTISAGSEPQIIFDSSINPETGLPFGVAVPK